jgi:nitric oxide reductase NorD protein
MGLFSRLLEKLDESNKRNLSLSRKGGSLESKQTGSSGGMSTTELLIRLELVMGQGSGLPLMDYANEMAKLSHPLQLFIFSQTSELSDLSYGHANEFLIVASTALVQMEQKQYERWLLRIKQALVAGDDDIATEQIKNYLDYTSERDTNTAYLSDLTYTLEKLVYSIHKSELPIVEAELSSGNKLMSYTDNEALYLPISIAHFKNYEDNHRLYKVLTFQLLGQIHCQSAQALGTLNEGVRYHGDDYLKVFSTIETLRIDQYIKREFPGLWRDTVLLHQNAETDYPENIFDGADAKSVEATLHLTASLLESGYKLPFLVYQSSFQLDLMAHVQKLTMERKAPLILNPTTDVYEEMLDTSGDPKTADRGYLRSLKDSQGDSVLKSPPPGWIPDSSGAVEDEQHTTKHHEKGVYYYEEWDTSLKKYRKDWCRLKEAVDEDVVETMDLENNEALRHAEHRIRKTFDQLVNDQKFIRGQSDGDEIDIDAWVSARSGKSKDTDDYENVYIRNNTNNRDVAIMFAVDLSGSTAGWKNTMIKQSTWLLCKTLARMGDQYAVYGFSGSGRSNCRVYPVKTFGENYTKSVKSRIFSMKPHQYTRMGVAIRHLSMLLGKTTAKTRILFVLTDGRPDDVDSYRGQYGVDDTRLALNEAKALSLKPFVLTFDKEGADYLPYMLGSNRYQLITDISQLPIQISTIYKQLTT